jgi:hypothetical protein
MPATPATLEVLLDRINAVARQQQHDAAEVKRTREAVVALEANLKGQDLGQRFTTLEANVVKAGGDLRNFIQSEASKSRVLIDALDGRVDEIESWRDRVKEGVEGLPARVTRLEQRHSNANTLWTIVIQTAPWLGAIATAALAWFDFHHHGAGA